MRENVNAEIKELDKKTGKLPKSVSKAIISLANTEGGELYICYVRNLTLFGYI